ncbi:MAG: ABC transporter permease [Chitinophagaceae bacterium]|nr:ABC transporter permease [Chitinophagaceae bacterium]
MFIKTCFTIGIILVSFNCFSQVLDIEEKAPVPDNGFEYGYIIKNEQVKSAGGEEYSRYELTLYITNKSGCTKMYKEKTALFSFESSNLLATFNCRNANGKRLTSKSGQVKARDFYISIKRKPTEKEKEANEKEKEITERVKAGYIFRNGETLKDNIIVWVPKGEKPQIQCTVNMLDELN